jgi:DNA-binding NarL/FixJ family response regulator
VSAKHRLVLEWKADTSLNNEAIDEARRLLLDWMTGKGAEWRAKLLWEVDAAEQDLPEKPYVPELAFSRLSDRQEEIARLLCENYSVKRIADKLYISENTVKKHIQNLKKTLSVDGNGPDFIFELRALATHSYG